MICQKYYRFLIYFRVKRTYYRLEIKMAVGIMKISFKKKKKEALPPINKGIGRQDLNKNPPEREN